MKTLALLVAVWLTQSAVEHEDLGVITRKRPILLAGQGKLALRVFPIADQTNILSLTKTNNLLTIYDLRGVPDGPAMIELVAVAEDGDLSEATFYQVEVRRRPPPKPKAVPFILRTEEEASAKSVEDLLFIRRRAFARAHPAPAPPGAVAVVPPLRTNALMGPLPGGTNMAFGRERKRRGE